MTPLERIGHTEDLSVGNGLARGPVGSWIAHCVDSSSVRPEHMDGSSRKKEGHH